MNTWYIENSYTHEVIEYFLTASCAKLYLKRLAKSWPIEHNAGVLRLVKITGKQFGEGWHVYYCQYDDIRDKFIYDRQ
jgi:hypothetical protein